MSIRRIPSRNGDKLQDTKTGELAGSIGKGKSNPPTISERVGIVSEPIMETDQSVKTQHEKYLASKQELTSIGDKNIALENEILRTIVGSEVVGMAIEGTGDRDEMGIYIETPEQVLGLQPTSEHYISRTVPQGARSGPGDVDLTLYSLRKYMSLALAGNPSILTILFAPKESILEISPIGYELRVLAPDIISQKAGWRHLGYLDSQRQRMTGEGSQRRVPNRPELIEAYGYDVKYASHALRLGLQGIELMNTGKISLPMLPGDLTRCMKVKRGEVSYAEALKEVDEVRAELDSILQSEKSKLQKQPNLKKVNEWMVDVQLRHWGYRE